MGKEEEDGKTSPTEEKSATVAVGPELQRSLLASLASEQSGRSNSATNDLLTAQECTSREPSYRDFSNAQDEAENGRLPCPSLDRNFVEKLHHLLSDMERENLSHLAGWQPHGRCFVVRKMDMFEDRILPV